VYSCNCGWIDKGHAGIGPFRVTNADITQGADNLWKQISSEMYSTSDTINGKSCFRVHYRQAMGKTTTDPVIKRLFTFDGKTLFRVSHFGHYLIRKGLSRQRKEEIALRIFLDVSYGFENMQAGFPFFLSSGFSQEDLISNLIGFYSAVKGVGDAQIKQLCKFVSKQASFDVWDSHIKDGKIGDVKNKDHTIPRFYSCSECKNPPQFPALFKSIKRATPNGEFIRYKQDPGYLIRRPQNARNFDRLGNEVKKPATVK
jgi:hypothetical protein